MPPPRRAWHASPLISDRAVASAGAACAGSPGRAQWRRRGSRDDTPGYPGALDAALDYAAREWYVIPLHDVTQGHCSCGNPHCEAPGKHPRITDWTNTASTTRPDPALVDAMAHANVGILTGERSGLAVLDVDPRNGGDLALEDLEQSYGPLPDTPMVLSGGARAHTTILRSMAPWANLTLALG